ncbi:TSUP family transporter [Microbulbifer variabilis]|uniref:TSUP family transporter n=1 Tax=Microbulbifer variabilis TaxID=266805 RepID=UPI0003620C35|nr:TSUP family transporter [Microbulbifer variabilis]
MEFASFSIELLSILFFIAVIAGLLDTLAGGGGLITVPALILSGVPPLTALGTNKLQGSIGTATATYMMIKSSKISWSGIKSLMLPAFIGAAIGTIAVQFINTDILSYIIPVVLLFIAVYFLISPSLTQNNEEPKLSSRKYKYGVIPLIGYYDGMFGPGTGSFFTLSGIACRGQDILTSTAMAKPLNFSTNLASLIIFLLAGHIAWIVGILMMIGQIIGAWIGSHCLFKINPTYLRGAVVLMCSGMLIKYAHSMGWIDFM